MLIAVKVVAIALAALLANYLLNQLSTLRNFPGKTWLLVRLIGYLVAITVLCKKSVSQVTPQNSTLLLLYGICSSSKLSRWFDFGFLRKFRF